MFQLPAPDFRVTSTHTKAILYAPKELADMDQQDRIRACYQHACLCWVSNKAMTNSTVRECFGIEEKNYPMASRIIVETIKAGLVKPADPTSKSRKQAKYVPIWL
jgi:ATP-dependent DNA helicase RecG